MPRLHQRNLLRVAGNKHHVARNKLRVARNMVLQATSCAQLVARNLLRWCKRGITVFMAGFTSLGPWVQSLTNRVDLKVMHQTHLSPFELLGS